MSRLDIEKDNRGVVYIRFARPEVYNAFDAQMIADVTQSIEENSDDKAVRVIVLAASGKLFCAGADIGWMQEQSRQTAEQNLADARRFAAMLAAAYRCPKPVVVRVQGHAFGAGVGLIAASDIAIAVTGIHLSISEAKFGIPAAVVGPYLIQALGTRQARRLALTSARISAEQAYELGLVHELTDMDDLDAAVERTVCELLNGGPTALREIKSLYAQLHGQPIDSGIQEMTARVMASARTTPEALEGFDAFLSKRAARWIPR